MSGFLDAELNDAEHALLTRARAFRREVVAPGAEGAGLMAGYGPEV